VSFAASSTLAKQIDNGAPADLFLSANSKWMDYLDERKMIDPSSRRDLLSNRIVLIAPTDSPVTQITITAGFPLAALVGEGRLAMGDPSHVPAGIYGRQALIALGVWESVASKIAPARDIRTALMLVERGETPIGLVYATDAAISAKVRVLAAFPPDCHPAITYPMAMISGRQNDSTRHYLEFLSTPEARAIFESHGFVMR
jgi:molybdate transport system substrate-binding protein